MIIIINKKNYSLISQVNRVGVKKNITLQPFRRNNKNNNYKFITLKCTYRYSGTDVYNNIITPNAEWNSTQFPMG